MKKINLYKFFEMRIPVYKNIHCGFQFIGCDEVGH